MNFSQKWFLIRRKLAFLRKPPERRLRLEFDTDGRHITFLLASLDALGYATHVVGSRMVFRELLALNRSTAIPFIIGGRERMCSLAMADTEAALARGDEPRKILLDYDFFNPERHEPRIPYFMHPRVYAAGLHHMPIPPPDRVRSTRIGFFGTRDADFYTKDFHFPILNREQILDSFLSEFGDRAWEIDVHRWGWQQRDIAVAIDSKGGDRLDKAFLPMPEYLKALRECDFFLSPPGWCMPLSHNLIEGMAAGCIPILNCAEFLNPPLEHGTNCLVFGDRVSLKNALRTALKMPPDNIRVMRRNVMTYYAEELAPGAWLKEMLANGRSKMTVLVNAEELSVGFPCQQAMRFRSD